MIIHIVLNIIFVVNILIALSLKKLHNIIKIRINILTYLKVIILLLIWIVCIVLSLILPANDVLFRIIYLTLASIVFAISVIIIGKQEKTFKSEIDVLSTWKKNAKDLKLHFLVRKYGDIEFPIIYGNYHRNYVEIFSYVSNITNNVNTKDSDDNRLIVIRVFQVGKPTSDKKRIFSFDSQFKEAYPGFSYLETHIKPDWSNKKLPELPDEFAEEVQNMIISSKDSLNNLS